MNINDYIKENWKNTIRITDENGNGKLIPLPFSYTVPSIGGMFQEMYYWDTYFTNKGLIMSDKAEVAKNNVNNMCYLVKRFGYMPNGNHKDITNRSQPPFLSLMVRDIYDCFKDNDWLLEAYEALLIEYDFWTIKRNTRIELSQYSGNGNDSNFVAYANMYRSRTGLELGEADDKLLYRHCLAVCESGWDISHRWGTEAYNYVQPELNALLYAFEDNMEYFCNILKNGDADKWNIAKLKRQELMRKYLCDNGIYKDYNMIDETNSNMITAASFFPLFVKCASQSEADATQKILPLLEKNYGLATTQFKAEQGKYQWSYPNGWAPLTYVAVKGLMNYGFEADAKRIAQKYVDATERLYNKTGKLWEKYNVETGNLDVVDEYGTPEMLGWSAAVYLLCKDIVL